MGVAWYLSDAVVDRQEKNLRHPPEFVSLADLYRKTGVLCLPLNLNTYSRDGSLEKIKREYGIVAEDERDISRAAMENYDQMINLFYTEHLHEEEEIGLLLAGGGYYDIRDGGARDAAWLRLQLSPGDLLVMPAGCCHRFLPDKNDYMLVRRLFPLEPPSRVFHPPADQLPARRAYLQDARNGFRRNPVMASSRL